MVVVVVVVVGLGVVVVVVVVVMMMMISPHTISIKARTAQFNVYGLKSPCQVCSSGMKAVMSAAQTIALGQVWGRVGLLLRFYVQCFSIAIELFSLVIAHLVTRANDCAL